MGSVSIVSVVLSILVVAPELVAGQHFLDLTAVKAAPHTATEGFGASGGVRGVEGKKAPHLPLEVLLTWVNRADLVLGGHIVSEVRIKNAGDAPVSLPWSPTRQPSVDGDLAERRLFVALVAVEANGGRHSLGAIALFGSAERHGSLLELLPGETATIRAPGWLTTASSDLRASLSAEPKMLDLRASVDISVSSKNWAEPLLSENAIPVTLRLGVARKQGH